MEKKARVLTFIVPVLVAVLGTGCGVSSGTDRGAKAAAGGSVLVGGNSANGGGTIGADGASSGPTGTAAPYSFSVGATGYTGKSITVSVGKVLKVKFAPGAPNQAIAGTGATAAYSALGVYIAVGSSAPQATPLLRNGYYGTPESTTIDFSSSLSTKCTQSADAACRQTVTISIGKPNLDYYCLNAGYYCPYTQAPSNVPWNATLTIQTDDTTAI